MRVLRTDKEIRDFVQTPVDFLHPSVLQPLKLAYLLKRRGKSAPTIKKLAGGFIEIIDHQNDFEYTLRIRADAFNQIVETTAQGNPSQDQDILGRIRVAIYEAYLRQGLKKGRGVQAARTDALPTLRAAAAYTYLFVQREWPLKKSQPEHPALKRAVADLAKRIHQWDSFDSADRRKLSTALLVTTGYAKDWQRLKLKSPLDGSNVDFDPEPFYKKFILPLLRPLRNFARMFPDVLSPEKNPYLARAIAPFDAR